MFSSFRMVGMLVGLGGTAISAGVLGASLPSVDSEAGEDPIVVGAVFPFPLNEVSAENTCSN